MPKALWERLRAARGVELLAALALLALLALLLTGSGGGKTATEKTELEARLERILSLVDGAGNVRAMVTQDSEGNVTGAVVVVSGEANVRSLLELQGAVTTLLEIDASRVEIIFSKGG